MDINMKELKQVIYDGNDCNGLDFGDCVWRKPYTVTFPTVPTGVGLISVRRDATESTCEQTTATLVLNGGTVLYGDTITITANPATGYNNPLIKSIQGVDIIDPDTAPHTGKVTGNVSFQVTPGLINNFSVSYVAKPTGVASFKIYTQEPGLSSSVYINNPTEPGSFSVPYGTKVYAVATATTGYNNPTITGISTSSSSPTTITGNIATYVTAGTVKAYTLTISSITGVASQTITRTSSPLKGAATGVLSNNATIYYGDKLTMTATEATGYSAPSVPSGEITVTGNIKTSDYISAGTLASYTVTLTITSGPGTFNKTTLGSSGLDRPEISGRTITIPSTGDSTYLNYNTYALQFSSARSTSGTWTVGSWNNSAAVTAYSNNYVIDDFTGGSDGNGNIYGNSVLYITTSGSANSFTSTLSSAPTNSTYSGAQTWTVKDTLGQLGTRTFTAPTNDKNYYYTISPSVSAGSFTPSADTTFTATVTRNLHTYSYSVSKGTGVASVTVNRTSSPLGGSTGVLASGATLYNGDVLSVSATASSGYQLNNYTTSYTVNGANVSISVTASEIAVERDWVTIWSGSETISLFGATNGKTGECIFTPKLWSTEGTQVRITGYGTYLGGSNNPRIYSDTSITYNSSSESYTNMNVIASYNPNDTTNYATMQFTSLGNGSLGYTYTSSGASYHSFTITAIELYLPIIDRQPVNENCIFYGEDQEELYLYGFPDEITFELRSGAETSAYYTWNGVTQQTGFNSIFDYEDLYDYDGSTLRIYYADYEALSQDSSENQFIQRDEQPVFKFRLWNGYWEQIG